ncbi:alpha/beta hydrolase [Boudabousia marimammalium]|uniref:Serine aminopeptidase S33 domain-containing protein n=1 Tax=Boudabousia marimammalium TaxID=156892 RepID=A0A1Q5PMC4_9ACTO|nr:alpha/beta hydrolase [Boudabousia marimammalium]OKL48686.1 hypothetical protein BM477_05680 [Boudabousia marimammalium]
MNESPAPALNEWAPDILGAGFEAKQIQLHDDDEGEVVCTLVRHQPEADPQQIEGTPARAQFSVLYIHGWNDYFFQKELARQWSRIGARFYAIDLRKYGRSWLDHQTFGYVDTLETYDEDMHAALQAIKAEDEAETGALRPLVLSGHSTGGLTATLWADRHPGALAGLVLNAPWLELSSFTAIRNASHPVIERIAAVSPYRPLTLSSGPNFYGMSLSGWLPEDGELPLELEDYPDDPSVVGWGTNPKWKNPAGQQTPAGWFNAVLYGHDRVAEGLDITCPILMEISVESSSGDKWDPIMRRQDTVLDVEALAQRAVNLGRNVNIQRFEAKHDVALSDPEVRREIWMGLFRWAHAYLRAEDGSSLCAEIPQTITLCP